jgi:hypothetical protein
MEGFTATLADAAHTRCACIKSSSSSWREAAMADVSSA